MKNKLTLIAATILLAATAFTTSNAQESPKLKSDVSEQTKNEIMQLNKDLEKSFMHNDLLKISEYYDDDATIMVDGKKVQGRKELSDYWSSVKDRKDLKLSINEIGGQGEYIYETGSITLATAEGTVTKNFLMLWKRLPNYEYKIYLNGLN
jgi:ketosteroid isomerase-like protein